MKQALLALALLVAPAPLVAQVDVGYPPPRSPFRDLEFKQEATLFGGYYIAGKDPAGIAPQSGPMAGIRYEVTVGGPAQIVARLARVMSERRVIDPLQPVASRDLGVQNWPLYLVDVGMSLNLTGQRSYRGVVPVIYAGLALHPILTGRWTRIRTIWAPHLPFQRRVACGSCPGTVPDASGCGYMALSDQVPHGLLRNHVRQYVSPEIGPGEELLEEELRPHARGVLPPLPLIRRRSRRFAPRGKTMADDFDNTDEIANLSDDELKQYVYGELRSQNAFDVEDIDISVSKGAVTLTGSVGTEAEPASLTM